MAFNTAFGIFGHFAFSSKPTHGQSIYESFLASNGDNYSIDFNGYEGGRLYARSMVLASAQYQLERAYNNRSPQKATELLGKLEEDYQVIPSPGSSLKQRRDYLSALFLVSHGNTRGAIEAAMYKVFGGDFIAYQATSPSDVTTWPYSPGSVGVFCPEGTLPKQIRFASPVSIIGTPVGIYYESLAGTLPPAVGEKYTVDPDPTRATEQITVASVGPGYIVTTFASAHENGTIAVRPFTVWISSQRHSRVILSLSAAKDPEKRRKANELMDRAARGVSQWSVASSAGTFLLDDASRDILDCTLLN